MEQFRVWAPYAKQCHIKLEGTVSSLEAVGGGWHALADTVPQPGQTYSYRAAGSDFRADPRSRWQPYGVHGASRVFDVGAYAWGDLEWPGKDARGSVVYELHIGTFTAAGTFDAAAEKLPYLFELGIDMVEVMPVASFPGVQGWGYDGVNWFAPHEPYGGPHGFQRFVDTAHRSGIAVCLDVVYNHFGPAGNYLGEFGPYLTDAHQTPWGSALNLDGADSNEVRDYLLSNARGWFVDFHVDALRLDAIHELHDDSPRHFLAELSDETAVWSTELGRPLTLIAESDRNNPDTVSPTSGASAASGLGMHAQWADDVHHAVHAWLTGERQGYYVDFGTRDTLRKALSRVFVHDGSFSTFRARTWGTPVDPESDRYDGHAFVTFLQNHDQVGNRAAGDRIDASVTPAEHAMAAALILCSATTPMLFMGEEWAAGTPWCYFTDHDAALGAAVTRGRISEFHDMQWDEEVPDPQALGTFRDSVLDWTEADDGDHAKMLRWYRDLIRLRKDTPDLSIGDLSKVEVDFDAAQGCVIVRRGSVALLINRTSAPAELKIAETGLLCGVLASFESGASRVESKGTSAYVPGHSVALVQRDLEGPKCEADR